ncbi:nicotinate-nucleotide adenylyltransferase [Aliisedimentitalea scapharcae]|uniref:Probable nicotinate-nucleotide adenylyltransferase n=1 Tax=Aliisedimentitalea scapharcae TaxID=1524259 RepID=A0ABZ2XRS8_9RHOB
MSNRLPHMRPGMRVGLLGGSFDPPHMGHVHITREALKRFGLDRVVWLVSPGNPLKTRGPAQLTRRMQAAQELLRHPRVQASDFETHVGTRYTAETLFELRRRHPGVQFVWLMGADNLAQFHRWKDWRQIMETVPVGVLARPGDRISARMSPAARIYGKYRLSSQASHLLGQSQAPAWCFVNVPMVSASSTEIRAKGGWPQG